MESAIHRISHHTDSRETHREAQQQQIRNDSVGSAQSLLGIAVSLSETTATNEIVHAFSDRIDGTATPFCTASRASPSPVIFCVGPDGIQFDFDKQQRAESRACSPCGSLHLLSTLFGGGRPAGRTFRAADPQAAGRRQPPSALTASVLSRRSRTNPRGAACSR
jgi:hypothetical protein